MKVSFCGMCKQFFVVNGGDLLCPKCGRLCAGFPETEFAERSVGKCRRCGSGVALKNHLVVGGNLYHIWCEPEGLCDDDE